MYISYWFQALFLRTVYLNIRVFLSAGATCNREINGANKSVCCSSEADLAFIHSLKASISVDIGKL